MSDLQCPATFVVVGPGLPAPVDDPTEPTAAVYAAPGRGPADASPLPDGALLDMLTNLADLHRGHRVLVLPARVEPPLTSGDAPIIVRIDADGAAVSPT